LFRKRALSAKLKAAVGSNIRVRHVGVWIACFAILLAALAPTVSRVLAAACNQPSCIAEGWSGGDAAVEHDAAHSSHHSNHESGGPAKKELHFEHCPFCATHAGSFGAIPVDRIALSVPGGSHVLLSFFHQSHHPQFAWVTPHSRAPPAFS